MKLLLMGATHLLLLFSSITYTNAAIPCPAVTPPTITPAIDDDSRQDMLNVFNKVRQNIVTQQTPEKDYLKAAKNMYTLFWNCTMEKRLINAVNKANGMTLKNKYAQNYAIFTKPTGTPTATDYATTAKTEWFNELVRYGVLDNKQTYTEGLYSFANMVNANATQIACTYKEVTTTGTGGTPGTDIHFTCIFNVKPVLGQSIYERGTPCTKSAQCTTYPGSFCDTSTKLCEYKLDVPETPTDVTTTTEYMTEAGRTKVVNAHNYRRTLLATGQIRNGKNPSNANLPTAAFMSKMQYDMALETQAIAQAKTCPSKKSEESTRTGYGENIYVHSTVIKDPVELFNLAAVSWWTQIFKDGINWQVIFKQSLADKEKEKGIDQTAFTQMAWAKTNKIGCAIVDCSGNSTVVCRYSPAGNILDQPIYDIGTVCSGSCPSGKCSTADGLCTMT